MRWPWTQTPPALQPAAGDAAAAVARMNRWRDQFNPLRGLTISSAVSMLDRVQAGQTADFGWTCKLIERRDEDLIALIDSTSSALTQLEWRVRTAEGDANKSRAWDEILAAEQSNALLDHYNRMLNVYETLEHLALAKFRGYSHAQISAEGEWLRTAEIVNHWNVCRDGDGGPWYWNPEAKDLPASSLPPSHRMDESAYLIVETPRPVDEVALIKYLRCSMSAKDWDAFIEIYGIPSWIITMPASVPKGQENLYKEAALSVGKGGGGTLPNGSTAVAAGYPAGTAPFRDHLDWWSQRLVYAATGGLLTSMALPTGIGSGASDAHSETFARIARGRARLISEEFQRKIDRPILDRLFPGRPHLAYFEFAANETQATGAIIDEVARLAGAGYRVSAEEVAEKTGYAVTDTGSVPAPPGAPIASRADRPVAAAAPASGVSIEAAAVEALAEARARNLAPVIDRLLDAMAETDPDAMREALSSLLSDLPRLAEAAAGGADADASLVERILSDAVGSGYAASAAKKGAES